MTSVLERELPDFTAKDRARLLPLARGSVGRALAYASLDLAPIEEQALAILRQGDRDNARRSKLASALGPKAAADRYAAFLNLAPGLIAREARLLDGSARRRALDAYARARETSRLALRLSLDAAATVFQLGSILASVAPPPERG
jgi:DNA polymerase-3 subunit delta'